MKFWIGLMLFCLVFGMVGMTYGQFYSPFLQPSAPQVEEERPATGGGIKSAPQAECVPVMGRPCPEEPVVGEPDPITPDLPEALQGVWVMQQLSVPGNDEKHVSDCHGYVEAKEDKTFYLWNACRDATSPGYKVEEAQGVWKKLPGIGSYKLWYPGMPYYYIVYVNDKVGVFVLWSQADKNDSYQSEAGVVVKAGKNAIIGFETWMKRRK
ncbi:MAG: hypothetical protein ACXABY_31875 [Candidatus Thorarchaeota archaeon]|jgi:hypothetical protein